MAVMRRVGNRWVEVEILPPIRWEQIVNRPLDTEDTAEAWANITGKPAAYPPSTHTHVAADITDLPAGGNEPHTHPISEIVALQAALDGKEDDGHTHAIADVGGLQVALDAKADDAHSHTIGDTAGLQAALDAKAASAHGHAQSDVTGLEAALAGKSDVGHGHAISAVTGLQTALDDKAAASHGHAIGDTTGLQAALDAKSATGHTHDWTSIQSKPTTFAPIIGTGAADAVAANDARLTNARTPTAHTHAPSEITGTAVITTDARLSDARTPTTHSITALHSFPGGTSTFLRADGTFATPSGGSDPWTILKLTVDFTTTSATAVDVTGLGFAPTQNTNYMIEAVLFLRTATATVNPRTGFAWPTNVTDGVMSIDTAQSATTQLTTRGNSAAALLAAVGGLPNTTQSWPAFVYGAAVVGASPVGNLRVQVASETAGTTVTVKAGSYLRYRTY
jgi:hypothetical protein